MTQYSTALLHYALTDEGGATPTDRLAEGHFHVCLLTDPIWPRAVAFTAGSADHPRSAADFDGVAEHLLAKFGAPIRWHVDLALFLEERMSAVAGPTHSIAAYIGDTRRTFSEAAEASTRAAQVWDLLTGRRIPLGALPTREEAYTANVANVGDLMLDTRFASIARIERSVRSDPFFLISDEFYMLGMHGVPLLRLHAGYDCFWMEREFTVRSWLSSQEHDRGTTEGLADELATTLHQAFFRDDHELRFWPALQSRARALMKESQDEAIWLRRAQR